MQGTARPRDDHVITRCATRKPFDLGSHPVPARQQLSFNITDRAIHLASNPLPRMEESRRPAAAAMAVVAAPTTAADPCASADDATIANIVRLARAMMSSTNDKANHILRLLKRDSRLPTSDASVRLPTDPDVFDRNADTLSEIEPPNLPATKPAQLEHWLEELDSMFKMMLLDGWDHELRTRWATKGLLKHHSLARVIFHRLEEQEELGELFFDEFVEILRNEVKLPISERTKLADELYNTPMRLGTPYREYLARVQHLQAQLDYPLKDRALIDFIVTMLPDLYREKLPTWLATTPGDVTGNVEQFHDCVHEMEQACRLLDHAPPQSRQTSGASGRKRRRAAASRDRGSAPASQPKRKRGGRVEKRPTPGKGSERSKSANS